MIWACCLSRKMVSLGLLHSNCQVLCTISDLPSFQHPIILACQTAQSIANTPVTEYGWKISCKKLYTIMHCQKTFSSVKSFCFPVIKSVSKTTHVLLFHWTSEQVWPEKSLILSICLILSPPRNNKKSLLRLRKTGVKIKQDVKIYNPYSLTWFLVTHINLLTDVVITFISCATSQIWYTYLYTYSHW